MAGLAALAAGLALILASASAQWCPRVIEVVPPCDLPTKGSVGDRAVLTASIGYVLQRCPRARVIVSTFKVQLNALAEKHGAAIETVPRPMSGQERKRRGVEAIYLLGTDVVDLRYHREFAEVLRSVHTASLQMRAGVVSFSFERVRNYPVTLGLFDHARNPVFLRPRNLVDCQLVSKLAAACAAPAEGGGPCPLIEETRDVAFLIAPGTAPRADLTWAEAQRSAGRRLLGANLFQYDGGRNGSLTFERLASGIFPTELCKILRRNVSLLLIPHDFRKSRFPRSRFSDDGDYHRAIERAAKNQCPGAARGHIRTFMEGRPYDPTQSRALIPKLDGVMSNYMHLLIISASAGVPGLAFASQGKFYSLQRDLYGATLKDRVTVPASDAYHPDGRLSWLAMKFLNAHAARAKIALGKRLPEVRARAERNFDWLFLPKEKVARLGQRDPPHARQASAASGKAAGNGQSACQCNSAPG